MQVVHVYIAEEDGSIGRSYDFLRNDGKDGFSGTDITVPFSEEYTYPILEHEAADIIRNNQFKGDN